MALIANAITIVALALDTVVTASIDLTRKGD